MHSKSSWVYKYIYKIFILDFYRLTMPIGFSLRKYVILCACLAPMFLLNLRYLKSNVILFKTQMRK